MKTAFKFLTITLFALLFVTSCQDEVLEESQISEQELIIASSELASLMSSTAARNGSVDNILDNANCLSINLPVTVIVNGITITINNLHDLELIEAIFDEFENDEDILELLFPITIVLNDHEEIVINNQAELDAFVDQCTDDSDDDIECIDFQYPISFSIYNTSFQLIETVVIENDRQLHEFLERIENSDSGALLVSLNFPITMVYANGETIEVHNNQELSRVLNEARENCDDEEACREDVVNMYLQECFWNIHRYDGTDNLIDYYLNFIEDGVVKVKLAGEVVATGVWSTNSTDAGIVLSISELTDIDDLGGDWLIVECDEDKFQLVREEANPSQATHMVIKQRCADDLDCSAQEVRNFLKECQWFAGSNLFDNVPAGEFYFEEDHVLVVVNSDTNEEFVGTWAVELTDEGIMLVIDLPAPYDIISKRWKISECGEHRVKMLSGDDYLVFESECNTNCSVEDVNDYLLDCIWNVVDYNGSDDLSDYELDFSDGQVLDILNTVTNDVISGAWTTSQIANDGVQIQFENINAANIQAINGNWIVVDCASDRIKLQNESGDYFIIEQNCD